MQLKVKLTDGAPLPRHAVDWYLVVADMVTGSGGMVHVCACPVCGREL